MRSAHKNIVGERVRDSKTRDLVWNDQRPSFSGNHLNDDAVQLHGILWTRQLCVQRMSISFETHTRAALSPETNKTELEIDVSSFFARTGLEA